MNPDTDKRFGKGTILWLGSRQESFFDHLSHYHCLCSYQDPTGI